MKVLYDISVLGLGQYNPLARTGVARVVENVAYGLAHSEHCDLAFCETLSFQILKGCLSYLSNQPKFYKIPFIHSSFLTQVYQKIIELNGLIDHYSSASQYSLENPHHPEIIQNLQQIISFANQQLDSSNYSLSTTDLTQADIFHATFFPIPPAAQDIFGLKRFLTVYDLIPILYPEYFGRTPNDPVSDQALRSLSPQDYILCISESTKQDICNYLPKFDPDRAFVTHLAADPDLFYPCNNEAQKNHIYQQYQIPEYPYILGLSTLEPRKNLAHLVRCFARLVTEQKISDLSLVLVGRVGWNHETLFQEIAEHPQIRNQIILTGEVNDQDLAALYTNAMVFVYPSFYEGFGLPPLEAMQCGVPVVTSNTSSLPEVVGEAGILLDPQDEDAWCESIWQLYQQPQLRDTLSQKSLIQSEKFSWDKCVQETIQAYQIALNS